MYCLLHMADLDFGTLYLLEPQYRERVWGGQRLKPQVPPIGEVWCAFPDTRVRDGHAAGSRLGDLARDHGARLLGSDVVASFGDTFPLLIKLLDCEDWLSVQVHPNDEQAARLEGAGQVGKTEAWHIVEAGAGAHLLAGVKNGTTATTLADAIRNQTVLDVAASLPVRTGETYLIPAGTMHALGPGIVLYEVQQASDLTYRIFDWGRAAGANRPLHIEQSLAVTAADKTALVSPPPNLTGTASATVTSCEYFTLDVVAVADQPFAADTEGRSFHVITPISSGVDVVCGRETVTVDRFQTALVAGGAGVYELRARAGAATVLRSRVPPVPPRS
jgi:mannose-6-phosphate isomerase